LLLTASVTFGCSGDAGKPGADVGAAGSSVGGEGTTTDAGDAGAGGASLAATAPSEIIGTWDNNFGGTEVITETAWNSSAVVGSDDAKNVVYTQFPDDDAFSPNKFAKTVYTEPKDDSFYFCMLVYSADTLEAAIADTSVADASDPDNSGCGSFSWSKATR
jgi:hypothetical protein